MPKGFDCVTLQGDKYDVRGTLTGGSQQQAEILRKAQEYLKQDSARRQEEKTLYQMKEQHTHLREQDQKVQQIIRQKEQLETKLYYLSHQAEGATDVKSLEEQLSQLKLNFSEFSADLEQLTKRDQS